MEELIKLLPFAMVDKMQITNYQCNKYIDQWLSEYSNIIDIIQFSEIARNGRMNLIKKVIDKKLIIVIGDYTEHVRGDILTLSN